MMSSIAPIAVPATDAALPLQHLGIVFKVTERCNLACPYCYFFFSGDQSYKEHPAIVPDDTVAGIIRFIQNAIAESGVTRVHIGFHGGEPLLLKRDYFADVCQQLIDGLGSRCKLSLSVQTNGVLINEAWINVFERFSMAVGVSFDGDRETHNRTRITKSGRGTYDETLRGWRLLEQAERAGRIRRLGVLCVIAPDQSGSATFLHFVRELKVKHLDFLLPDLTHDSIEVSERFIERCGDYLVDVCRAWFAHGDQNVTVRFMRRIMRMLLARTIQAHDPFNAQRASHTLLTVSSNGDISPDDVLRTLDWRFRETGFHVATGTLREIHDGPMWGELRAVQQTLAPQCNACIWNGVCGGGLKQHRYSLRRGFNNPSIYCKSLARMYAYICAQLAKGGIPVQSIEQRLSSLAVAPTAAAMNPTTSDD
ncbi:uncharacterized protein JOD97_002606 [Duganella sp. 1411]|uniref:radical SAM protein n=1 Tax=Duganella sp. 1411 TaxID=2806572 RepID=UPI001AE0FB52|nr:radical SAM protein [Duganella sp. 1411]MBP1204564.1 uncharacterized protein [Duganella sp. 1411]